MDFLGEFGDIKAREVLAAYNQPVVHLGPIL